MKSRAFSRKPLPHSRSFLLALAACFFLAAAATLAPAAPVSVTKPKMRYGLGSLKACAYSNDGRIIVTAGGIGAVLWDSATNEMIRILSAPGHHVYSAAFFADGETTRVLTGGIENRAILWNAVSGAQITTFTGQAVAFSPDGTKLLTGSGDLVGTDFKARLYNAKTFAFIHNFTGHTDVIYAVAFSADGAKIVTGSADQTAKLWNTATGGAAIRTFSGHTSIVQAADISPDGTRVLTGSWDGTAILWDAATGNPLYTWTQHADIVRSVDFSHDGSRALTAGDDATARIWNTSNGSLVRTLSGHTRPVLCARFSKDSLRVLTASEDSLAREWNTATGSKLRLFAGHTGSVESAVFSPDGAYVLTGGEDNIAKLWNKETGELVPGVAWRFTGHTDAILSVAISADGKRALTGSKDKTAKLWTFPVGNLIRTFSAHNGEVSSVALSPNGSRLITGSFDGMARIWSAISADPLTTLTGHVGYVSDVAFSTDASKALTAGWDGKVKLWNSQTGALLRTLSAHSFIASSACFSPDSSKVLTGGYDKTAKIWDAGTGGLVRTFSAHTSFVNSVAYSSDGAYALTVGLTDPARLWETASGNQLRLFSGHTINALSGSFSPDDKQIVTAGEDGLALLWDTNLDSGRKKQKLILVAGGGPYSGSRIAEHTKALARRAHRVATVRGYTDDDILYLSAFNESAENPDVDGPATSIAILDAILTWASDASDLTIMLIGHTRRTHAPEEWNYLVDGTKDPEDVLSASMLDAALDTAQSGGDPLSHVCLFVDTVLSGGFLKKCFGSPAGTTRIILTGTSDARLANFGYDDGGLSFTGFFLTAALQGNTLQDCFEMARISLQRLGSPHGAPQSPWMDDDGDGQYTEGVDGAEAAKRVFGNVPALGFLLPEILTSSATLQGMVPLQSGPVSSSLLSADGKTEGMVPEFVVSAVRRVPSVDGKPEGAVSLGMKLASTSVNVAVRVSPGPISRVRTIVQPATALPPADEEPITNLNVQNLARVPDRPTEWTGSVDVSGGTRAVQLTFIAEHEDTFGTPLYGIPVSQTFDKTFSRSPWFLYE